MSSSSLQTQTQASSSNAIFYQPQSPEGSEKEKLWRYLPLYRAAMRGDKHGLVKAASSVWPGLTNEEAALRSMSTKITAAGETLLHVLIGSGNLSHNITSVIRINPSDLWVRDREGHTPLCLAAMVGNVVAAKYLLKISSRLVALDDAIGPYPIIEATRYGHKDMVLLLIGEMDRKMGGSPPTKQSTASLFLNLLVVAGFYDVLLALVRRHPGLARAEFYGDDGESLLSLIAGNPCAFRSGTQLNFWQQLLYSVSSAKFKSKLADIEKAITVSQSSATHYVLPSRPEPILKWFATPISSFMNYIGFWTFWSHVFRAIQEISKTTMSPIKHIKDTKSTHEVTLDIVKCLCKELMNLYYSEDIEPVLRKALLLAASSGISEIIEGILEFYPGAIWFVDSENHNLFHLAVINRHEKVFNLIYQMSSYKHLVTTAEDTSGNNILHLAGKLAPPSRLNLISGAALQMQRELQWFQEVEKFVHPTFRTKRNSQGKTPKMVFTEEHKELVRKGEKWMKETANSCTFVAALTATVGFAAAITVPGGNNQNSGFPLFSNETAFTIFAVSDAFCLFSSVASVIMFLSILTSRYAEGDFLVLLPKRLILGLSTLFFSMTSLMIAFCATIYLVFGEKRSWILIPVGIAALMPIVLFESLQFPLLLDMFTAIYGLSIFRKQSSRLLY